MTRLFIQDRQTYKTSSREYTDEGFLRAKGRVAKTGTQQYLRRELGLDGDPNAIITVYRPPEEVFAPESLATYNVADITYLHPKKLVDSETFKSTSTGVIASKGYQDGDFVVCDLLIKDAEAIKKVESGDVELSAGYTAEYHHAPGVTADGVAYEYVQRGIRINHVALLPINSARAGRQARIFDTNPERKTMRVVNLDSGRSVEFQDDAVAQLVEDSIARLTKQVADANKAKDEAMAEAEKSKAKADAKEEEAEEAKKAASNDSISARIAEIVAVKDRAAVIDSAYVADGVDTVAIMRGVLASVRPNVAWADKSAEYVQAAFDMAHESAKDGVSVKNVTQLRQMAQDGAAEAGKTELSAADQYKARFTGQGVK